VNTVFCTIGFGDISGSNSVERIYCVILFYLGVFVFGSLLVEVQDAINKVLSFEAFLFLRGGVGRWDILFGEGGIVCVCLSVR